MAHSNEIRQQVRDNFINARLPLTTLANKYCVSYATLQSWKRQAKASGDDWDIAKSAKSIAQGGDLLQQVQQDFDLLFTNIRKEVLSDGLTSIEKVSAIATLADAQIKTAKALGMRDPKKARLGIALETLNELTEFIKRKHNGKLIDLVPILLPFGEQINKKWG